MTKNCFMFGSLMQSQCITLYSYQVELSSAVLSFNHSKDFCFIGIHPQIGYET